MCTRRKRGPNEIEDKILAADCRLMAPVALLKQMADFSRLKNSSILLFLFDTCLSYFYHLSPTKTRIHLAANRNLFSPLVVYSPARSRPIAMRDCSIAKALLL